MRRPGVRRPPRRPLSPQRDAQNRAVGRHLLQGGLQRELRSYGFGASTFRRRATSIATKSSSSTTTHTFPDKSGKACAKDCGAHARWVPTYSDGLRSRQRTSMLFDPDRLTGYALDLVCSCRVWGRVRTRWRRPRRGIAGTSCSGFVGGSLARRSG